MAPAAEAATKTVSMGPPPAAARTFERTYLATVNDFFPHGVSVRVGDSVRFVVAGFHSIEFPARGRQPVPFIVPGPPVENLLDAAGAPFWFNGQPQLGFNLEQLAPAFGRTFTYTGRRRVTSGLPIAEGPPRPVTVKFTRRGTYTYYCNIHAGMEGRVRVAPKNGSVPTPRQDARRVQQQIARDINTAKGLRDIAPAPGVVHIGSAGAGGVEHLGMVPSSLTVPAGTTLRFQMTPGSYEPHTATFGPGDPENDANSYLGQLAASLNMPFINGAVTYPSEPPGATGTLTPALHGNGFWNSGILDASTASPLPNSSSVTFGAPGAYAFYCLIHPFMKGTITVQ
jgi:plastocyanin